MYTAIASKLARTDGSKYLLLGLGWAMHVDLYHAVTILIMFPVSITVTNANIHCANMAPDYYFVQPQFGTMSWNGVKSR